MMVGHPTRQQIALAAMARQLAIMPEIFGALIVGSLASGAADAASDIDLIVCPLPGQVEAAWSRRSDMRVTGAMVCWDSEPEECSQIAVHRWVTDDMVLVEAMFAAPGSRARLAVPWRVVAGDPDTAALYAARPPIERTEFNAEAAHPVDRAFWELKLALRSLAGDAA